MLARRRKMTGFFFGCRLPQANSRTPGLEKNSAAGQQRRAAGRLLPGLADPALLARAGKALGQGLLAEIEPLGDAQATVHVVKDAKVAAKFGYRSAMLLHALATKGASALPANPIIDTGVEVVTKDNVVAFKTKLGELKK